MDFLELRQNDRTILTRDRSMNDNEIKPVQEQMYKKKHIYYFCNQITACLEVNWLGSTTKRCWEKTKFSSDYD